MAESTKTIVIDSSAIMAILMPDEKTSNKAKKLAEVISSKYQVIAPKLLVYEVGNSLRSAVLSKRISLNGAKFLLDTFIQSRISFKDIDVKSVFKFAIKHNLTFYDASYLYLANTNKCKLLTLDKKLEKISK